MKNNLESLFFSSKTFALGILTLLTFSGCSTTLKLEENNAEKITIRRFGISDYIWYKDFCGQDYIGEHPDK